MKKILFYTLSLFLIAFSSCSDLLDVSPRASIDAATALTTEEALDATLVGAYDAIQSTNIYGRDLIAIPEVLADNGRATNKSGRLNPEYQNQPNAHMVNTWGTAYFAINQLNLVIDAAPSVKLSDAKRASVEGQALFLRGLLYFELMKVYAYMPKAVVDAQNKGGVPLITKGVLEFKQIENTPRAAIDDCYKQIVADLTNAITKLAGTAASRAPYYATKGAAQGILSRVYLYMGDWANAEKIATDALASGIGKFQPTASYITGWRAPSHPESMFELNYLTPENIGVNTSLQTTYTTLVEFGNTAKTGGFGDLVPSAALLTLMESEKDTSGKIILDIRRQLYERGTAGRGTAEIECTKFFGKSGAVNLDNIPVIRISEMYLTRAEALFNQGKEADALKDLNVIRTRAGLVARTATLTGAALLTEILNQRRLELAFEGHRFFDLKRLGRDITKLPTNLPFTDFRILAPLPVREIQTNANLKQNFGY
jgi:starch-binding outer membrane protein, SusD/RagB family